MGGDYTEHAMKKEEAHKLMERMPANATWDGLRYEIDARVAIERGLADSEAGRVCSMKEVRE
jgi:predicted transcriptional regulator